MSVRFVEFDARSCRSLFRQYCDLKYEVFVAEKRWKLPLVAKKNSVKTDNYDRHAMFFGATTGGQLIAVVRTLRLDRGFPRRRNFRRHLRKIFSSAPPSKGVVISALCVRQDFRGRTFRSNNGANITIAKHLLRLAIRHAERGGVRLFCATVNYGRSKSLFTRLGFCRIDDPVRVAGTSRLCANVILLLGDRDRLRRARSLLLQFAHRPSPAEDDLIAYVAEQERELSRRKARRSLT
jgi:N-acyl-L-homoserine lactone synthetase